MSIAKSAKMTTPSTSSHIGINRDDDSSIEIYEEEDRTRLIKPRNNFASYSNEDINVRFFVSVTERLSFPSVLARRSSFLVTFSLDIWVILPKAIGDVMQNLMI